MEAVIIIFGVIFIVSIIILMAGLLTGGIGGWAIVSLSFLIVGSGIILFSIILTPTDADNNNIKPIEYPASEYTFKIKVIEFEEQRDTILVITPKEK